MLVKVKRPHLNKYFYEFPAGSLKSTKEKPLKAAKRELIEETGVHIRKNTKFIKLPSIYSMADRLQKPMFVYYVNLKREQLNKNSYDKQEISQIKLVNYFQLKNMILKGQFSASVPIALLYMYLLKKKLTIK